MYSIAICLIDTAGKDVSTVAVHRSDFLATVDRELFAINFGSIKSPYVVEIVDEHTTDYVCITENKIVRVFKLFINNASTLDVYEAVNSSRLMYDLRIGKNPHEKPLKSTDLDESETKNTQQDNPIEGSKNPTTYRGKRVREASAMMKSLISRVEDMKTVLESTEKGLKRENRIDNSMCIAAMNALSTSMDTSLAEFAKVLVRYQIEFPKVKTYLEGSLKPTLSAAELQRRSEEAAWKEKQEFKAKRAAERLARREAKKAETKARWDAIKLQRKNELAIKRLRATLAKKEREHARDTHRKAKEALETAKLARRLDRQARKEQAAREAEQKRLDNLAKTKPKQTTDENYEDLV